MKSKFRRFLALSLAALLCLFCLTGCTIDVRQLLGRGTEDEEEEPLFVEAELGGEDVPYPEGFDISARFKTETVGDTLCIVFNGIGLSGRDTGYFTTAGDTITITGAATTDSSSLFSYKAALWEKTDQGAAYVDGCTVRLTADGELYTAELSGLEPGTPYKLTISYDSGAYTISGGMSVSGLASAEAPEEAEDPEAAAA